MKFVQCFCLQNISFIYLLWNWLKQSRIFALKYIFFETRSILFITLFDLQHFNICKFMKINIWQNNNSRYFLLVGFLLTKEFLSVFIDCVNKNFNSQEVCSIILSTKYFLHFFALNLNCFYFFSKFGWKRIVNKQ